ncbi:acyl-CoA dehydrogenase family protein [Aquitalea sp. LB_tupeE]|uniref:acyl-CoA dehydrogenase family protein n=1 Tax=Aquitalea sp. LB_tupeE TaxID=2748078 RepID=UPI0015C056BD|nr:acyl-CoA dehydrogenase family protein [Aquitalea sp. LB_tupeE]NWK79487.1 acyl-CoA dehydrogenase family protein [Aquitalea sp. LB_tupeE]
MASPSITPSSIAPDSPLAIARELASRFARTAVARDQQGGTPKAERDALRDSGLLGLIIPREFGGLGESWASTLQIVRELARVDSSVAHVFAFQHLLLATAQLFGRPDQWQPWFEQTVRERWFWGNALNPLDTRTLATPDGEDYRFHGDKSFCSGATDSDILLASALRAGQGGLLIAVIPTRREGVHIHQDWDNIGQRQTDSGSARFEQVRVRQDELLLQPGPLSTPRACLRPLIAQLILTNIYLGIAEGAVAEARRYTLEQRRLWPASLAASANKDPYTLLHYGEFQAALEGARLLTDHAAHQLDEAWQQGDALDEAGRGQLALQIAAAKVHASRSGLDLTSRIFDVTGARATSAALRLDRFWRNLRVHSLHDPLDYKLQELGDWALNGQYPTPSFYS